MNRLQQIAWLAYRDFVHEKRISLCFVLALTAILSPLLALFALKFGLIDTLTHRLLELPQYREIIPMGSQHHKQTWFEEMAGRPDVAFIVPDTRHIAASFARLTNPLNGKSLTGVQIIPTGSGDPLLEKVPVKPTEIHEAAASHQTALKLGITAGVVLKAYISRLRNDMHESVEVPLKIVGITPESALPADGLFVPLDLLVATEDYRDGMAVALFGWPGASPLEGPRSYSSFRLYAKSIYDVAPLSDELRQDGVDVVTQASEIESMQSLDSNLTRVFWLLAGVAIAGFLVSLSVNQMANVERKRRELSMVGILGVPSKWVVFFPMAQAGLIGTLGIMAACIVYFPVARVLNFWFRDSLQPGEFICRLLPSHFLTAAAATLLCAVAASAWAGFRVSRIEPAEGIRDV